VVCVAFVVDVYSRAIVGWPTGLGGAERVQLGAGVTAAELGVGQDCEVS